MPEPYVEKKEVAKYLSNLEAVLADEQVNITPDLPTNHTVGWNFDQKVDEKPYTAPTPQIAVNDYETFYSLHIANSFRVDGKTYVLPRILGFMSPVDESGVLRTYSAGASFPVNDGVKNSVNRHEIRHNWIHDEHTNREQDKAEGTDAYSK